jgi:hypothetical protein
MDLTVKRDEKTIHPTHRRAKLKQFMCQMSVFRQFLRMDRIDLM